MDIYDEEIERLIRVDGAGLHAIWVSSSLARTSDLRVTGYEARLFAICGNRDGCGCPTQINYPSLIFEAQTPELTEKIRGLEGIPNNFYDLSVKWDGMTEESKRLSLQPFAIAERWTDEVLCS